MVKRVQIIVSFCLFLMSSNIAHSDSMGNAELKNVLANLIIWLEDQSYIKYENIISPNIKIINTKEICSIVYGEKKKKINNQKRCAMIMGLYDFYNKTIYISHDVDLNSNKGQAIILHELVHHYQYESGGAGNVVNVKQLEYFAYYLEKKFIKENSLLASK